MSDKAINILYVILFSINSLSTSLVVAFTGVNWGDFTPTQRFVVLSAVTGNWTTTLLALLQRLRSAEKKGKTLADDNGNTTIVTKDEKTNPESTSH